MIDLEEEFEELDFKQKHEKIPVILEVVQLTPHSFIPNACMACPNHPNNGGSGICHCVLGTPTIY